MTASAREYICGLCGAAQLATIAACPKCGNRDGRHLLVREIQRVGITPEEIERLRALSEAATPGPWFDVYNCVHSSPASRAADAQATIAAIATPRRGDHDAREGG